MNKHSPGPWKAKSNPKANSRNGMSDRSVTIESEDTVIGDVAGGIPLMEQLANVNLDVNNEPVIEGQIMDFEPIVDERDRANLALMLSAPKLKASLKEIVEVLEDMATTQKLDRDSVAWLIIYDATVALKESENL